MVGNTEYNDGLRIGIRKGDAMTARIFGKAVASLTPADHIAVKRIVAMGR